jgi:hypothetical protein
MLSIRYCSPLGYDLLNPVAQEFFSVLSFREFHILFQAFVQLLFGF